MQTFSIWFFMGKHKPQHSCSLQLRVRAFTMPGFQILTRCSLFRADMLFFLESKCITSIVQKTGIIHLFEFKHSTSTSQTDKESYFVLLNVEAVQFLVTKNLAVNHFPLDAPPAVQTWTLNCWNATEDCSLLTFSGLLFVVFHEKPYRKSIIVIPENHDTWNILKGHVNRKIHVYLLICKNVF